MREIRFDEIDDEYIVRGAMTRAAVSRRMAAHYRSVVTVLFPAVCYYSEIIWLK